MSSPTFNFDDIDIPPSLPRPSLVELPPQRLVGRKRHRVTRENNENRSNSLVIDLTDDSDDVVYIEDNPPTQDIPLPPSQNHEQFLKDQLYAQQLYQQEIRSLERSIHENEEIQQPRRFHGFDRYPRGGTFRPPWSNHWSPFERQPNYLVSMFGRNLFDNSSIWGREFTEADYEFLSSLDNIVSKKKAASGKEISTLPIRNLRSSDIEKDNCCTICLVDFVRGDRVRTLPCSHYFHVKCINKWLRVNKTCPIDRKEI